MMNMGVQHISSIVSQGVMLAQEKEQTRIRTHRTLPRMPGCRCTRLRLRQGSTGRCCCHSQTATWKGGVIGRRTATCQKSAARRDSRLGAGLPRLPPVERTVAGAGKSAPERMAKPLVSASWG